MAVHACFIAIVVAASLAGGSETLRPIEETPLIAGDPILADVNQITVVLGTGETPGVERLIDAAKLKAQVSQNLRGGGISPIERDTETAQRLVVHVEGIEVPGGDTYVYRVQTALDRLVTVPGQGNRRIRVEVWRVRPVMAVAAKPQAGEAISAAVLVQAGAFAGACEAARSLAATGKDTGKEAVVVAALSQAQSTPQALGAPTTHAFIASKSSEVFHRPDCRWAQNISGDNLIGYKTREEAVESGKRPCKSCKP